MIHRHAEDEGWSETWVKDSLFLRPWNAKTLQNTIVMLKKHLPQSGPHYDGFNKNIPSEMSEYPSVIVSRTGYSSWHRWTFSGIWLLHSPQHFSDTNGYFLAYNHTCNRAVTSWSSHIHIRRTSCHLPVTTWLVSKFLSLCSLSKFTNTNLPKVRLHSHFRFWFFIHFFKYFRKRILLYNCLIMRLTLGKNRSQNELMKTAQTNL